MELKEFIEKALLDITDAIHDARLKAKSTIAPANLHYGDKTIVCDEINYVEFDLATHVTTQPTSSGKAEAKISIIGVSASISGNLSDVSEHGETSRIKFKVPVAFNAKPAFPDKQYS